MWGGGLKINFVDYSVQKKVLFNMCDHIREKFFMIFSSFDFEEEIHVDRSWCGEKGFMWTGPGAERKDS